MSHCNWLPFDNDEILAWVETHRETLPATLAELSAFPMAFRRVTVNYVSPELRTTLWQDHLRSYRAPSAALTREQRAFVEDVIPTLADIFQSESREWRRRRCRRSTDGSVSCSAANSAQRCSGLWVAGVGSGLGTTIRSLQSATTERPPHSGRRFHFTSGTRMS